VLLAHCCSGVFSYFSSKTLRLRFSANFIKVLTSSFLAVFPAFFFFPFDSSLFSGFYTKEAKFSESKLNIVITIRDCTILKHFAISFIFLSAPLSSVLGMFSYFSMFAYNLAQISGTSKSQRTSKVEGQVMSSSLRM
jgi:hypothetical protein